MKPVRTGPASFTLVEILVVITIIGLLAGIAVPAVGGALNAARKAKAMTMANQIRTAMVQFQTEYGFFPTNGMGFDARGMGTTTPALTRVLVGSTNATNDNPRQIVFLEVPAEFTSGGAGNAESGGIMTPRDLYKRGSVKIRQFNYSVAVDHDYDSRVWVTNGSAATNISGSCHVWIQDPTDPARKTVGTWK
jgi:prepilin-type N-terminal cleavage/methylation domain-containing protein